MYHICDIDTPLGQMFAAADDGYLAGLWFAGQKNFAKFLEKKLMLEDPKYYIFDEVRSYLSEYFSGARPELLIKINPRGTPFQKSVWQHILRIPYGKTSTYGEIAHQIAAETGASFISPQAIGSAVAKNPIAILIPCHRVIDSTGSILHYIGRTTQKSSLLKYERDAKLR